MADKQWSNRFAFIVSTSAFAVGLGNVWRFPYITGEAGGGAFLLVYLGLILLIGIPILCIEIGLGRMSGSHPLTGYGKLGNSKVYDIVVWVGALANILIMFLYVMILSWILIYLMDSLGNAFADKTTEELTAHFDTTVSSSLKVLFINFLIILAAAFLVSRGLKAGIEQSSKWMLFGFIVLMIGLAIWSATLDGAMEGYAWYLKPDFSKINFDVLLSALGQLFFSVGVGMSIAFSFGSLTSKDENIISATSWIVFMDTIFAVIAGFMIFPAIFTFGLSPDSGPNLIFVTMTTIFGKLGFGSIIGGLFFLLLFLGGFTSLLTSVQGLQDSVAEKI